MGAGQAQNPTSSHAGAATEPAAIQLAKIIVNPIIGVLRATRTDLLVTTPFAAMGDTAFL